MVNFGYASNNDKRSSAGRPFIAAYDTETGAEMFVSNVGRWGEQIQGFEIIDDDLLLAFKYKTAIWSLSSGKNIAEQKINSNYPSWNFTGIVGSDVYMVNSQGLMVKLSESDNGRYFLYRVKIRWWSLTGN